MRTLVVGMAPNALNRERGPIMRRNGSIPPWVAILLCVFAVAAVVVSYEIVFNSKYIVAEVNDYVDPPEKADEFADDKLEDKNPTFKEDLIDSRPVGDWELNASAAVIGLDCPKLRPELDDELLVLNPSYAKAVEKAEKLGRTMLPSANLLDGAAKQFDDGLYAALDLACFRGKLGFDASAPECVESFFQALPEKSPARPFLAGALKLADKPQPLSDEEKRQEAKFLADFANDPVRSKPISFYDWRPELEQVWKFYRYLQWDFDRPEQQAIPKALSAALKQNDKLVPSYRKIYEFYARLTNPPLAHLQPLVDFADAEMISRANSNNARGGSFVRTVFPPSTSREVELFEQLFPDGLPPAANLMSVLIRQIRAGKVDLRPKTRTTAGINIRRMPWNRCCCRPAQENEKLLLTAAYKKRLVEAFKALLTKRRETHERQLAKYDKCAEPLEDAAIRPRLRVEPCLPFTCAPARAYAFLQNFLLATVGNENLSALQGLNPWGHREPNLAVELESMRLRFYGFYVISCEDLGMAPQLLPEEPVDQTAAKTTALKWIDGLDTPDFHVDMPDLAIDTRMSIPITMDPGRNVTRLWATLGVRLAPLEAKYARPPKVRPKEKAANGPIRLMKRWARANTCWPSMNSPNSSCPVPLRSRARNFRRSARKTNAIKNRFCRRYRRIDEHRCSGPKAPEKEAH